MPLHCINIPSHASQRYSRIIQCKYFRKKIIADPLSNIADSLQTDPANADPNLIRTDAVCQSVLKFDCNNKVDNNSARFYHSKIYMFMEYLAKRLKLQPNPPALPLYTHFIETNLKYCNFFVLLLIYDPFQYIYQYWASQYVMAGVYDEVRQPSVCHKQTIAISCMEQEKMSKGIMDVFFSKVNQSSPKG